MNVCCSVLQCVAECCSVLQFGDFANLMTAKLCEELLQVRQCVLQYVAAYYRVRS